MISTETTDQLLGLPEADRLELARRLIESVASERDLTEAIAEGVHRIEEVATGRIEGLTEEQFRSGRR